MYSLFAPGPWRHQAGSIASPSPEEVLARLNIKSHLAAADLPVAQRRCVFLFAHGAGGTRPRSESHTSMRWVRILQRLGDVVT
ncbi:MAG: hypothetical protein ACPIOQ_37205, partial [Promethearchaeia archaeon]